jgi:hypothetical protein
MPNLKKVGLLSLAVLVAQMILTKGLYPLIGKSTQTMFAIEPVSGVGGTQIGNSVLGYLTGFTNFDVANLSIWLAMAIGVFVLIYVGFWLYEQEYVKLWKGTNLTQRIFAILLYGHVILYAVLLVMKWQVVGIALNLLIGLVINLTLVATIVTFSAEKLKFPRI